MKKSPLMKYVGMGSWLITALASLNIGLASWMGWNFFATDLGMRFMGPLLHLIGLSGLISLGLFVMGCMCKCGKCGSCKMK